MADLLLKPDQHHGSRARRRGPGRAAGAPAALAGRSRAAAGDRRRAGPGGRPERRRPRRPVRRPPLHRAAFPARVRDAGGDSRCGRHADRARRVRAGQRHSQRRRRRTARPAPTPACRPPTPASRRHGQLGRRRGHGWWRWHVRRWHGHRRLGIDGPARRRRRAAGRDRPATGVRPASGAREEGQDPARPRQEVRGRGRKRPSRLPA